MTIPELKRRWKQIDLRNAAASIISDNKQQIADFNREQLMDGFNKEGKKLKKYRSSSYAQKKNQKNPSPGLGNPDLYLTGRFHEAMNVKINSKVSFDIFSTDSKTPDLTKKYGKDIFGLTDESRLIASEEIINPGLVLHIKKIVNL